MPVYEYECESCGLRFERMQSMNYEPIHQCPECSGVVHKVFHAAGIIFKGSGWYITDSRKSTSGTVTGETKTASGNGSSADAGAKTPAKTETKSESKRQSK